MMRYTPRRREPERPALGNRWADDTSSRLRRLPRVRFAFTLTVAAYTLVRLPKLLETA